MPRSAIETHRGGWSNRDRTPSDPEPREGFEPSPDKHSPCLLDSTWSDGLSFGESLSATVASTNWAIRACGARSRIRTRTEPLGMSLNLMQSLSLSSRAIPTTREWGRNRTDLMPHSGGQTFPERNPLDQHPTRPDLSPAGSSPQPTRHARPRPRSRRWPPHGRT